MWTLQVTREVLPRGKYRFLFVVPTAWTQDQAVSLLVKRGWIPITVLPSTDAATAKAIEALAARGITTPKAWEVVATWNMATPTTLPDFEEEDLYFGKSLAYYGPLSKEDGTGDPVPSSPPPPKDEGTSIGTALAGLAVGALAVGGAAYLWKNRSHRNPLHPTRTFATARAETLHFLRSQGWTVVDGLKVPHATAPDGQVRVWFKPQAVYLAYAHDPRSLSRTLGDARSMHLDDLRAVDGETFLRHVREWREILARG